MSKVTKKFYFMVCREDEPTSCYMYNIVAYNTDILFLIIAVILVYNNNKKQYVKVQTESRNGTDGVATNKQ